MAVFTAHELTGHQTSSFDAAVQLSGGADAASISENACC